MVELNSIFLTLIILLTLILTLTLTLILTELAVINDHCNTILLSHWVHRCADHRGRQRTCSLIRHPVALPSVILSLSHPSSCLSLIRHPVALSSVILSLCHPSPCRSVIRHPVALSSVIQSLSYAPIPRSFIILLPCVFYSDNCDSGMPSWT